MQLSEQLNYNLFYLHLYIKCEQCLENTNSTILAILTMTMTHHRLNAVNVTPEPAFTAQLSGRTIIPILFLKISSS